MSICKIHISDVRNPDFAFDLMTMDKGMTWHEAKWRGFGCLTFRDGSFVLLRLEQRQEEEEEEEEDASALRNQICFVIKASADTPSEVNRADSQKTREVFLE